jgi:alpha-tubulin suppressor-like RCC1 family protein
LEVVGPHDVIVTNGYKWQSSWLGSYYLPINSPLINHGSTNANLLGLYHFTTQTNQVKETNSIVDIGYHYVATDAYGNPLDTDGDGVPDFLEDANGNGLVDSGETNWALAILTQPVSQVVPQGTNVTFTITAGGIAPLSYQWYFNSGVLTNATSATLTLTNVQPGQAGTYSVVVANVAGSVTSSNAVLTVNVPPVITQQPVNVTTNAGGNATFSVTVSTNSTPPLSYQWRKNGSNLRDGGKVSGANSSTLTLTGAALSDAGIYTVVVTNVVGRAVSSYVVLRVWTPSGVVAWGYDGDGEIDVPVALTNVVAIAGGGYHSLALKGDGTVIGWGYDGDGETDVPVALTNVVAIATGRYHSLALKADGTVVGWGDDSYGETDVPSDLTNVVAIAGGGYHSLALKSDGTVVGWGDDGYGETDIPSALTNVVAIAGGGDHSLALKSDGTVVGWGYDGDGEIDVPVALTNVVAIAGGDSHSLALKGDGTVIGWGYDGDGETDVPLDLTNVVAIATGRYHSLALKDDGTVAAWGADWYGETDVPSDLTNVVAIAGGGCHSLALGHLLSTPPAITTPQPVNVTTNAGGNVTFSVTATGTSPLFYQWRKNGSNLTDSGEVSGANSSTLTLTDVNPWDAGIYSVVVSNIAGSVNSLYAVLRVWTPSGVVAWGADWDGETDVPSDLTNAVVVAGGEFYSLALKADGTVVGWGDDSYGETDVPSDLTNVVAIATGGYHSLALKADGIVVGWGYDGDGETDVPSDLTNAVAIAGGGYHSLALKGDGTVVGWGYDGYGETDVPSDLTNVVAIAAGYFHSLALKGDGTMVGWGYDGYGETDVPSDLTNAVAIAAGSEDSLALKGDGTVMAWGADWSGETDVPSNLTNVVAIAAGGSHSLALENDGTVVAWGNDGYGETDIPSGLTNVVVIAGGGYHSLALGQLPPGILTQPQSQAVLAGSDVTFSVTAIGTAPLSYQWYFNSDPLVNATNVTLPLTNAQPGQAGTYSVVVANVVGSVTSSNAVLTVNAPPAITQQPQNQVVNPGGTATFSVMVSINSTSPLSYQWSFDGTNSNGATNTMLMLTNVQFSQSGDYAVLVTNAFGSVTSSNATLTVSWTMDSDYDGVSDAQEIVDATDPFNPDSVLPVRLGYWRFDDTNTWVGDAGQLPLLATNIVGVPSWNTNAVLIDSTNPAILTYRDVETNGNPNINCRQGTVRFWFRPDWSSTSVGGNGPGSLGRLIEVGNYNPTSPTNSGVVYFTNGWWALYFSPDGTQLSFGSSTNGAGGVNLSANIALVSNQWHQVVLTYSPMNSILYVDGKYLTNGQGSVYFPNAIERARGFRIGSDANGTNQAGGAFDELETFNYSLDSGVILTNYQTAIQWSTGTNGLPNIWQINNFGHLGVDPNGDPDGDHLSNLQEYNLGTNPNNADTDGDGRTDWQEVMDGTDPLNSNSKATSIYKADAKMNTQSVKITTIPSLTIWASNGIAYVALTNGMTNVLYDLYGKTNLLSSWIWLGKLNIQGQYTNATSVYQQFFWTIGGLLDSDGDGLTDDYERYVTHTDPNNPDSDYDGRSDGQEILLDGTDPNNGNSVTNVMLAYWRFNNTNTWVGEAGQLPIQATNIVGVPSWGTNAVLIDTNTTAILKYHDMEPTNYAPANINCRNGTVQFWFAPDWNSGTGPGSAGRLIEMGSQTATTGWWSLYFNPSGTQLIFGTQTNGLALTNLTASINWTSNYWHQIVLTYSSNNSSLYVDGQSVVTNGLGANYYPNRNERANGFCLGSDLNGNNQARGIFDELQTFNYPLSATNIAANYQTLILQDSNGDGMADIWKMNYFGTLSVNPNGDPDGDGLTNLQEYQGGTNPNVDDSTVPGSRLNYIYDLGGWLQTVSGAHSGSVSPDSEGNIKTVSQ